MYVCGIRVKMLFSVDKTSSMLIRSLAPWPLMIIQVRGDVTTKLLKARRPHPSLPSIRTSIGNNECSPQPRPAARNWSHDYEFI